MFVHQTMFDGVWSPNIIVCPGPNARAQLLYCSLSLLFNDVAVAVMVFLGPGQTINVWRPNTVKHCLVTKHFTAVWTPCLVLFNRVVWS